MTHVANGPRPAPPVAQCDGKTGYETLAMAGKVLARMMRGRGAANGRVSVYRCPHCTKWHVGRSIGPGKAR